ncbi:MAG: DUF2058 domain-containing protein [Candidatus Pelagadaptatus aseana]|uniref:DUF2058 domain-containing protein n=1 Tax=Candidatus Pelagadaptatus aseana TaxID=3120508 RepID=UPI0039B319C3
MSSLQDQLLQAGLVDAKKAKKASKDKRKAQKVQKKSKQVVVDETKAAAAKAREDKAARDRQLNEERKAEQEKKAIQAQIRQLISMNRIEKGSGADLLGYNFTDGKSIKKIHVTGIIQKQLERGQLAIVKLVHVGQQEPDYELVPAAVADKISQRDQECVISRQETADIDEDDPYADYQIPDDLMW